MSFNPPPEVPPYPPENQTESQPVVAQVSYPQVNPIVTYLIMGIYHLCFPLTVW